MASPARPSTDAAVAETLERIEHPPPPEAIVAADVGVAGRVIAFEPLHKLVPGRLAVGAALLAGRAAWLVPRVRRNATDRCRPLFDPDTPDEEVRRFARRHLPERLAFYELFWQPELMRGMAIDGIEHLDRARAGGRGAIVATVHLGPLQAVYFGLADRLRPEQRRLYPLGYMEVQPFVSRGRNAPYAVTRARRVIEAGIRVVGKGGGYPVMRELLTRGEVCLIALDLPSSRDAPITELAGRRVRLATGPASLAKDTGVPIVPVHALRDGTRPVLRALPAIDPDDFDSAEALHLHLAGLADRLITKHLGQVNSDFFWNLSAALAEGATPAWTPERLHEFPDADD